MEIFIERRRNAGKHDIVQRCLIINGSTRGCHSNGNFFSKMKQLL